MKLTFLEDIETEPTVGVEVGLADIIISSINKKWDNVRDLNTIIVNLEEYGYGEYSAIIEEILEDENNHIGKLQYIVEQLTPAAENIDDGKQEAEDII